MIALPQTVLDDCWNQIGVAGDRSCPRLPDHVHCRNCPVFADGARVFFDRPAPEGYLQDWTAALAEVATALEKDLLSVVVFRLGEEWLALGTPFLAEVTLPKPTHRVPHRSNRVLVGLVNIRGQLLPRVSLHGVLGIELAEPASPSPVSARFVVVDVHGERWVFAAEAVAGVERVPRGHLRKVPGTHVNRSHGYSQGLFPWHDHHVGLLDEERVVTAFRSLGS